MTAALEAVRPRWASRRLFAATDGGAATLLVVFAPVVGLAGAQGGYFPSAWGWGTLPLLWTAGVALVVRRQLRLSVLERGFISLLVVFVGWVALSTLWSVAPAASVLEVERDLLYVTAVVAVLVVARSRHVAHLLAGVLAAVAAIAAFSLASRILPDRVGVFDPGSVYRLAHPIGYWNGLALFTGIGALLALTFAARGRGMVVRASCAALLVLLLPTFYFTFGRAAWIGLAAGLVAAVLIDPRRLELIATLCVVGPIPAVAVWVASKEPGLTRSGTSFARAVHDGHRFALVVLGLAAANAVVGIVLTLVAQRVEIGVSGQRAFGGIVVLVLLGALVATFARYGGPVTLVEKGYDAFRAPPPHVSGNLNRRLFSFSGNGRADIWRLAWHDTQKHPMLGSGSGTYERYYLAHQPPLIGRVRDAHSLYIETLAELGPIGLALLLSALSIPLLAIRRALWHPLTPGAVGGYVAYLVHTGVDWDWELPAVTLAGLMCAAAILLAGRRSARSRSLAPSLRWGGVAAIVVLATFAAVGLAGNTALSRSESARKGGDWASAVTQARRARLWMRWSPRPWVALARAQMSAGLVREARVSYRKAVSMDRGDWQLWYDLAGASTGAARRHALEEATRLYPASNLIPKTERVSGAKGP